MACFFGVYPLILTARGQPKRYVLIAAAALGASIWIDIILHHRLDLVASVGIIGVSILVGRRRTNYGLILKGAAVLIALALAILYFIGYATDIPQFASSWLVDDRSFVFDEFYKSFNFLDWVFGRGALGTYYSPYFADLLRLRINGGDDPVRQTVELGYLQYVLKLGVVGFSLYLLLNLVAARQMFFRTLQLVPFGIGVIIALRIIGSIVGYSSGFWPETFTYWLLLGVGCSQQWVSKVSSPWTSSGPTTKSVPIRH